MNRSILVVFSIIFLGVLLVPAYAQIADNVVINEVDTNPPGNDADSISEWVELYNPTDSSIDLGGWKIASTTVLKKTMTIPDGTVIAPGQFLTYSYQSVWFTDSGDSIELRSSNDVVVDKTPTITDIQNDFSSWQRIYDGYDLDSSDDWKFATSTTGSSNGKLVETQESESVSVSISSDQSSYLFGETAIISGSVSEELFVYKPYFQPEDIEITITGPNFNKVVNMYPDLNLDFETSLTLHQVLGVNEGTYDISVKYADATDNASFTVGHELFEQQEEQQSALSIMTDNSQYIPGQFVSITGITNNVIPFEGLKFKVIDAAGAQIYEGSLFPTNNEFKTSVYVTTVDPTYGTYQITGEYFDQAASATFEVVEDFKEDVPISLWSDKPAYSPGDEVTITGRLNQIWISTLDLEVVQTKNAVSVITNPSSSDTTFKILDGVTIMGDGSFSYKFTIPDNDNRLGDYRINVSKDVGSASHVIYVVDDPDNYVVITDPLTIETNDMYNLGDTMTISGFVTNPYESSSYLTGSSVEISVSTEDGSPLEILALPNGARTRTNDGIVVSYDFTAVLDTSGRYSVNVDLSSLIFKEGTYIATATYGSETMTSQFTVIDPLALEDGAVLSLDKEVYGLGETVTLSGILPPLGSGAVDISVIMPDGTVTNSGATFDSQRLTWTWETPITEQFQHLKDDGRNVSKSNFGIYKIVVSTGSETYDLFFKVSEDPENDSLSVNPIFVTTEKPLYKAGERLSVIGNVIVREQGSEGLVVPERVSIKVLDGTFPYKQIHEATVYPNQGGEFSSLFELPATVFSEGTYIVKSTYLDATDEINFSVANDFVFGLDAPVELLLYTDNTEYNPGDTVVITGKPNKLIYLEKFDVSVIQQSDAEITCGSFYCGEHVGPVTTIRPSPSGSFAHQFVIPEGISSIGSYEVTVDADFDAKSIQFNVVEPPVIPILDTVIEKENRIPETIIPIFTEQKTTDNVTIAPRVISGSLITPDRGQEYLVNLKVSTVTGTCIIGPDVDCLVKESTRKPGQIYDVVEVDGMNLNVRYSGPDVRLEKFSILPESSIEYLPDANWQVEVLKDDQTSRFYYKVTYKTLE